MSGIKASFYHPVRWGASTHHSWGRCCQNCCLPYSSRQSPLSHPFIRPFNTQGTVIARQFSCPWDLTSQKQHTCMHGSDIPTVISDSPYVYAWWIVFSGNNNWGEGGQDAWKSGRWAPSKSKLASPPLSNPRDVWWVVTCRVTRIHKVICEVMHDV